MSHTLEEIRSYWNSRAEGYTQSNREELEGCHPQYIVAHPSEVAEIVKKKNESHGRME